MQENYSLGWKAKLGLRLTQQKPLSFMMSMGAALLFTLIVYFLFVPLITLFSATTSNYIVALLAERGFIPPIIVFFFWLMTFQLLIKYFILHHEIEALEYCKSELELSEQMVYTDAEEVIQQLKDEKFASFEGNTIFRLVRLGMRRLMNTQDTNALTDYFKQRSEIEYTAMESGFSNIKYINWLIPTLGFIGTVLGIGVGIAGFADIIVNAGDWGSIQSHLPKVTSSLGVAFDTTFLALILSVMGMFQTSYVSQKYHQFLEEVDAYCLDDVSSRFKLHSTVAEELKTVLREIKREISEILAANRIDLTKFLKAHVGDTSNYLDLLTKGVLNIQPEKVDLSVVNMLLNNIAKEIKKLELKVVMPPMPPIKSQQEMKPKSDAQKKNNSNQNLSNQ